MMGVKFFWNEKYSVNVELIDEQHRTWFGIINHIFDLLDTENLLSAEQTVEVKREKLSSIVSQLREYAFFHLATEEGFFRDFKYEDAEAHIAAHNAFRKKYEDYLEMLKKPDADLEALTADLANFSRDWLASHILIMDKKYTKCFNSHGLDQ